MGDLGLAALRGVLHATHVSRDPPTGGEHSKQETLWAEVLSGTEPDTALEARRRVWATDRLCLEDRFTGMESAIKTRFHVDDPRHSLEGFVMTILPQPEPSVSRT